MKSVAHILCAVMALTSSTYAKDKATKLAVYVQSSTAVPGFTDPNKSNADTLKDLQRSIRDPSIRRHLVLAADREHADIVLTVLGRDTGSATGSTREYVVHVRFEVPAAAVDTELAGRSSSLGSLDTSWSTSAHEVVVQIDDWAKKNAAALATVSAR